MIILAGRIVDVVAENPKKKAKRDKNIINIKVQSAAWKKPLVVEADKTQSFYGVLFKCAEAFGTKPDKLRLAFDGDAIELDSKPIDLDFEGGEILDCHLLK